MVGSGKLSGRFAVRPPAQPPPFIRGGDAGETALDVFHDVVLRKIEYVDYASYKIHPFRIWDRLFLKDLGFASEKELRACFFTNIRDDQGNLEYFGVPRDASGLDLPVEPATLILRLVLGPHTSDQTRAEVRAAVSEAGLDIRVDVVND